MPKSISVQAWSGPVQPGDTLILGFGNRVSDREAAEIRQRFAEFMPGVKIVVLDNVTAIAVHRPE